MAKHWQFIFNSVYGRKVLNHPPRNFNAIKFNNTRDKTYKGITRKFTTTLEFCDDGYEIIRDLFFNYGIDAELRIEVNQLVGKGWKEVTYSEVFWADFSECDIDEMKASIKMTTSDFERKLNDRQGDSYDLNTLTSVDGDTFTGVQDNYRTLKLPDRTLVFNNKHTVYSDSIAISQLGIGTPFDMDYTYVSNENLGSVSGTRSGLPLTGSYGNSWAPEYCMCVNSDKNILVNLNLVINGTINLDYINDAGDIILRVLVLNENLEAIENLNVDSPVWSFETSDEGNDHEFNYENEFSVEIPKGYSMILAFQITNATANGYIYFDKETSVIYSSNIDYINETGEPTDCNVMLPHEAFERVLQIMTGVQEPLYSPIFGRTDLGYPEDGELAYMAITNGLFVRQFPITWTAEDGTIKTNKINTSFKDMFTSYNSITPLAAYVEKLGNSARLVIDKYETSFNASTIGVVLSDISELSFAPNADIYYSTIKCGYKDEEHEEVNGLESFCGEVNYSCPVGNTSNTYDIISKYVADDIAWSLAQRKPYSDYPTEDTRHDDKIMIIDAKIEGDYLIPRKSDEFTSVEGIFAPEKAFNLNISPVRNLLNHKKIISSGLLHKQDKKLKFTKGSKNENLATQKIGESSVLYENADIDISDLGLPIFTPNIISLKTVLTNEQYDYIVNHPSEVIEFAYNKRKIYGFIDDLSYDRFTEVAELKLLQSNR